MIGISSVAMLIVWTPTSYDLAAQRSVDRARLRDGLSTVVNTYGLYWLQQSTPSGICAELAMISNSTVSFSAIVDGTRCAAAHGQLGGTVANLTVRFSSRLVDLESWYTGRA